MDALKGFTSVVLQVYCKEDEPSIRFRFLEILKVELRMVVLQLKYSLYISDNIPLDKRFIRLIIFTKHYFWTLVRTVSLRISDEKWQSKLIYYNSRLNHNINFLSAIQSDNYDEEFLFVLEDDISVFVKEPNHLDKVLRKAFTIATMKNSGIALIEFSNHYDILGNISGNVKYKGLDVLKLDENCVYEFFVFDRPVTNTTCAIAISLALKEHFGIFLISQLSRPGRRLTPIDWLLNEFLISRVSTKNCLSMHVRDGVIKQKSSKVCD